MFVGWLKANTPLHATRQRGIRAIASRGWVLLVVGLVGANQGIKCMRACVCAFA